MPTGKLILLRHGQTTYNEQQLMCGQFDAPLTPLGESQAKDAGKALAGMRFDKIYSSSLSRAFNTASLALDAAGIAPSIDKRDALMECDAGDFAGRSLTDPEILAFPRNRHMELPNGESEAQFVARIRRFYEAELLPRVERGETVLVVSHAGVMHALDAVMNAGEDGERSIWDTKRRLPNTAIVVVDYENGKITGERMLGENPAPAPKPDASGTRPHL